MQGLAPLIQLISSIVFGLLQCDINSDDSLVVIDTDDSYDDVNTDDSYDDVNTDDSFDDVNSDDSFVDCPSAGTPPIHLNQVTNFTRLTNSQPGTLCTLSLAQISIEGTIDSLAPVARSYEGNHWEALKGPYNVHFDCFESRCRTTIPPLPSDNHAFILTTYSEQRLNLTLKDKSARFLEQTTFGPTLETVEELMDGVSNDEELNIKFMEWVHTQMYDIPATSHRESFRERVNNRLIFTEDIASPTHPCVSGSRWRPYAFVQTDVDSNIEVLQSTNESRYTLSIDGIPRTEIDVQDAEVAGGGFLEPGNSYEICRVRKANSFGAMGSKLNVIFEDRCKALKSGNPRIQFSSPSSSFSVITLSPEKKSDFANISGVDGDTNYVNEKTLNEEECSSNSVGNEHMYLNFTDGTFFAFEPRINIFNNTLDYVNPDGGFSQHTLGASCFNAPRTFLNEDSCVLSSEAQACSANAFLDETKVPLEEDSIIKLYELTNRYVYAVSGLKPDTSPCQPNLPSRWELVNNTECQQDQSMDSNTMDTLKDLINRRTDPKLRDISFSPRSTRICNVATTNPLENPIAIQIDSMCWKLVHPNHFNVYDMTPWVSLHPGGPDKITQFALNGEAILEFPDSHPISRWENNKELFPLLGKFQSTVLFQDLPQFLKLESVAEEFGAAVETGSNNVVVCGSPGEIQNNKYVSGEREYKMRVQFDEEFSPIRYDEQKSSIWVRTALTSSDQLRQRVAWALSQIIPIVPDQLGDTHEQTEMFVSFYDIFVRHAFGNYRNILKEIAYNPLMAVMLSYIRSKSTAYYKKTSNTINYADENFAREIMQLFSIGTVMLNMDGTPILDPETNATALSYTNDHIMSFARTWTGFDVQGFRGNVERYFKDVNNIDPMRINPVWRDPFPKIDLLGGYIGDGYPLCVDMPERFFLRKGAKYRLLGSSTVLELQTNPSENVDVLTTSLQLKNTSKLYEKLCNPTSPGISDCRLEGEVILNENIPCDGQECFVESLRLVQLSENVFFEYVFPACVRFPYYDNPKLISTFRNDELKCADPRTIVASEACCHPNTFIVEERNCVYVGERMKFATAVNRCQEIGYEACQFTRAIETPDCYLGCCKARSNYFWQNAPCDVLVKINKSGYAAVVYGTNTSEPDDIEINLRRDTINFFPVHWTSGFPSLADECGMGACSVFEGNCLCNTEVVENMVFTSMPNNVEDLVSELHIGSFSPDTFDSGLFQDPIEKNGIKAYLRKDASYDENTVFEVTVRNKISYFRNIRSDVKIVNITVGEHTAFSFRNPPNFMNLVEFDRKDAEYETDAVLDDYFYHPNTAPFISSLLIQRFGISNPSPRYVKEVATAFSTGTYKSDFGSGEYGDLGATIAAIVLDREARSSVLGWDPSYGSLREPLLKIIGYMRSMNFQAFPAYPEIMLFDMDKKVQQMVYSIPSVFSFFLQDYTPEGPVQNASLVAPEAQILNAPSILSLLEGLYSITKYGLTSCNNGFGLNPKVCPNIMEGDFSTARGELAYRAPIKQNTKEALNELSMLLTAGRLSQESLNLIEEEVKQANDDESGLRLAQQLIVSSPEFHSTSLMESSGEEREGPIPKLDSKKDTYKSVVYLYLRGGVDSYNILVPHSGCVGKDMFEEYRSVRAEAALSKDELLTIDAAGSSQVCDTFGLHPKLTFLQSLYDEGDALFFANVGVLFEPVTKETWKSRTPTQLFAHNVQLRDTQQVDPFQKSPGTGAVGRMADVLTKYEYNTGSFSMGSPPWSLKGEPLKSPSVLSFDDVLFEKFNSRPSSKQMHETVDKLNSKAKVDSGFFGETWAKLFDETLHQNDFFVGAYDGLETTENFPSSSLGRHLEDIALTIQARNSLNMDRQFFQTGLGTFDFHANMHKMLDTRLSEINDALSSFVKELKAQGVWDDTVLIMASEFGRSMTPNGSAGTDHGWGGNYFMIGGNLDGGRILGKYPDDLTEDGPLILNRGRVIPTTSWDSIMNGVAQWVGVEDSTDLDYVLPNRGNFGNDLFDKSDLFGGS